MGVPWDAEVRGLGFRAGFLEEAMPDLKLAGVHSAGGEWQGDGGGWGT